jgi:DNA polymerase III epsilon subunit family exonuclease
VSTQVRPPSRRHARRGLPAVRTLAVSLARRIHHGRAATDPARRPRSIGAPADLCPAELLRGADLVVVDVETTGWLDDQASITEIGAVRLSAGRPAAEFSTLVNPGVPIPAHITALTGITDAMVHDAPVISEALPRFLEFADGSVIAAHNAPFDIGFLAAACHACGMRWRPAVIDTAALSRLVLGPDEVPDHKLSTLASLFAARTGPCHRALADARATVDVLTGLLGLLARPAAAPLAGGSPTIGGRTATMAPQPGRGLPGSRRRLWSRR